jgi:calcineurin-like phosphoesterase family protein
MQNNSTSNITGSFYESIDEMPIYNWNKIIETGDLKWIFKNGGRVTKKLGEVWVKLQDEYFLEFGLDDTFKKQLRLMKEVIKLNDEFIQNGDRSILNLIHISEVDLQATKKGNTMRFYDLLDRVMSIKKMYIDPKQYTVVQWYYTLKNLANGQTD